MFSVPDIISKLDHFKDLHIGVLSVGGIYACDKDGILDHVKINPRVGTSDEFDLLISEIHMKGIPKIAHELY